MTGELPRRGQSPPGARPPEDAEVVREMYRALEAGDDAALARATDPGLTWVHPLVTRLPFDGTRRGMRDALRAAFRRDEAGSGPRVSAETVLSLGDGVLVAGRFLDGPKDAGEPFLQECHVRGGRVVLIREYPAR